MRSAASPAPQWPTTASRATAPSAAAGSSGSSGRSGKPVRTVSSGRSCRCTETVRISSARQSPTAQSGSAPPHSSLPPSGRSSRRPGSATADAPFHPTNHRMDASPPWVPGGRQRTCCRTVRNRSGTWCHLHGRTSPGWTRSFSGATGKRYAEKDMNGNRTDGIRIRAAPSPTRIRPSPCPVPTSSARGVSAHPPSRPATARGVRWRPPTCPPRPQADPHRPSKPCAPDVGRGHRRAHGHTRRGHSGGAAWRGTDGPGSPPRGPAGARRGPAPARSGSSRRERYPAIRNGTS